MSLEEEELKESNCFFLFKSKVGNVSFIFLIVYFVLYFSPKQLLLLKLVCRVKSLRGMGSKNCSGTVSRARLMASGSETWAGGQKEIHLHPSGLDEPPAFPPKDQVFMGICKQLGGSSCGDTHPTPFLHCTPPHTHLLEKAGGWGRGRAVIRTHRRH